MDNTIQIVFHDRGSLVSNNEHESDNRDKRIVFKPYSNEDNQDENQDETQDETQDVLIEDQDSKITEQVELPEYGLYSVIAEDDFSLTYELSFVPDKSNGDNNNSIVISQGKKDFYKKAENSIEIFPTYNDGFVLYGLKDRGGYFLLSVNGCKYRSNPVRIYNDDTRKDELMAMVQEIYSSQPLLLLSVFQNTPISVFVDKNSNINNSIDNRLSLIEKSIGEYERQYLNIRKVFKYKLKENSYVDRIGRLNKMSSQTIAFIARNPQYLVKVDRKKGIKYKEDIYLPSKTLVTNNAINYDTYENRYILSFLKMLIYECDRLRLNVSLIKKDAMKWREHARIQSKRNDFDILVKKCELQENKIMGYEKSVNRLFSMYKMALSFDENTYISPKIERPKVTAIFRQIPEYNMFYTRVFCPWFEFGTKIIDAESLDVNEALTTSASSPNTSYELYIVVKWIEYFEQNGYSFRHRKTKYSGLREKEARYLDYAYEFSFVKNEGNEGEEIYTLYYSPSVYLPKSKPGSDLSEIVLDQYNVDNILFRSTASSWGIQRGSGETYGKGSFYEPDFIIKYEKQNVIRYLMADAKHKNYDVVYEEDVQLLIGKYINSIKPLKRDELDVKIAGLCAVYSEHKGQDSKDLSDEKKEYFEYNDYSNEKPQFCQLMYMNVFDKSDSWKEQFTDILELVRTF